MSVVSELRWAVKESLLNYIEGLPDGQVDVTEPAYRDSQEFVFPKSSEVLDFDLEALTGDLRFQGRVLLTGHWGAMRVELSEPLLKLNEGSGELLFSQLGLFDSSSHFSFATIELVSAQDLVFRVSLTQQGKTVLGGQYQAGETLSPLTLRVS